MRYPTTQSSTSLSLLMLLQQQNAAAAALSISSPHLQLLSGSPPSSLSLLPETQTPPNQNLLTYLSTTTTYTDTSIPISSSSLCTSFISRDKSALLLPNARIPLSPAGFIDCFLEPQGSQAEDNQHQKQQLVFKGIPAGWQFSITKITLAGWLDLERGAFVERVSLSVGYPEGEKGWKWKWGLKKPRRAAPQKSHYALIDTATSLTPYGRFGTGYQGTFNLSMPVKPPQPKASVRSSSSTDKGRRDQLALSPCSTGPEMEIALGAELWFSLSHEQIDFDDTIVHWGRLGGEGKGEEEGDEKTLRVGVTGRWTRC
ncbi:hypothetical protein B0H65DRAFT_525609 [Neurospora tetraspora]|uniref:Uncharacterized protein n=1 Tax=Neurospora tetraspora TaxID=94610 RepID=A0AAE0JFW9_9PEZI|nr:hypothetical protein B0H65DRAFT_525609 [Neurospora tetraspora]